MGAIRTFAGIAAAMLTLTGCMGSAPRMSRTALIERIGGDAAAFNEAYSHAVNAQILLNILRSRDRQPRYYLSTTGISDAPSFLYGDNISIGSFPLGEQKVQPWGFGSFGAKREITSRPSYAVQPLAARTLTKAVFQPTPANVFAHYWESGWPRDILLLLAVEKIGVTRGGRTQEFTNEANDIRDDCAPAVQSTGCAFVGTVRQFLDAVSAKTVAAPGGSAAKGVCGLIEAYDPPAPVRALAPSKDDDECAPTFVVGDATYRFDLRSFDDMVYYVGELMRASYTESQGAPDAVLSARVNVRVAGLRGGGKGTPLFRIVPKGAGGDENYSAQVAYDGVTYQAGPPIGRSCADAAVKGMCQDDAARGDRSSSVLSLLAELLALNQSPDAIRPPARLISQ